VRVDPGAHVLIVTAPDHRSEERRFVAEGAIATLELTLSPGVDERPGTLVLRSNQPDTYFVIGGQGEGLAPFTRELPAGRYEIIVRGRDGERTTEVEVPPGRRIALTLDPPERSLLVDPWFWVVTGVAVAGVVAGAIAISRIEQQAPPLESEVFPTVYALGVAY
jgi:hypothetical protein